MAYFRSVGGSGTGATITVTYSSEFYGETITCSHGTKTYSKVAPSTGTVDFTVYEEGTWTISCTIGTETYSTTADIDLTASAVLDAIPNGETVTPTDDVETWLACAEFTDKSYTTISQVLADSETYNALLGDSNACAYMKRSTTWSTDICASQYAMNLLGQYDTACDALLSDSTWASAIANSTYFESVLNVKVPVMTSNTTPSGECFGSSYYGSQNYYLAFDGNATTYWYTSVSHQNSHIGYMFTSPVKICKTTIDYKGHANNIQHSWDVQLHTSDDGATYDAVSDILQTSVYGTGSKSETIISTNPKDGTYYKLTFDYTGTEASSYSSPQVLTIQFYGRTPSSEKIHGGNPTYDSFYRIVDGNHVPVTDPSLLDAGTYTIYSNGLAKDPDNLSNDYGKTVRICPNTKEIVVRPDFCLSWLGYLNPQIENVSTTNGWSCSSWSSEVPTYNEKNITYTASSSRFAGIALKQTVSASGVIKSISKKITNTDFGGLLGGVTTKALSQTWTNYTQVTSTSDVLSSFTLQANTYPLYFVGSQRGFELSALWIE